MASRDGTDRTLDTANISIPTNEKKKINFRYGTELMCYID